MKSKTELQTKIGSLTQRISVLQSELDTLRDEGKVIRARMVDCKVASGEVETASNGASHELREILTRQDVLDDAISELEKQRKGAQQELDDLILAETSIPWREFEADLWPAIVAMQKQVADMNQKLLSFYARASQAPAVTPDSLPLKHQIPIALQAADNGLYQTWQALESINGRSPRPVNWPSASDGVPGFGKKL